MALVSMTARTKLTLKQNFEMLLFSFAEAAEKGVKRAIDAGCQAPLLYVHNTEKFPQAETVAILVSSFCPVESNR